MVVQAEQVQRVFGVSQASSGDDTSLALDQGKPWCSPPNSLSFMFETLSIILYACALNVYELYRTVVALRYYFLNILVTIPIIVTGR
jgi:hypothetical protein